MRPNARASRHAFGTFAFVNGMLLGVFTLLMIYPMWQCLIISFSHGEDIINKGVVYFWPRVFSVRSYENIFKDPGFLVSARNSVLRTVLGTTLSVLVTSMFAYAISHHRLRFRPLFTTLGLVTMYFSGGMIPTFIVIKDLGLIDNFLVYLLPGAFSMFNVLVFLAYFKTIPDALEESAVVDGANEIRIFFRIMLPVAKPVVACIVLFVAVGQWNSWFDTMLYTDDPNLEVLSFLFAKLLIFQQFVTASLSEMENVTDEQLKAMKEVTGLTSQMASMMVTIVPIICVYPFVQKHFVKGIMIGSLKG